MNYIFNSIVLISLFSIGFFAQKADEQAVIDNYYNALSSFQKDSIARLIYQTCEDSVYKVDVSLFEAKDKYSPLENNCICRYNNYDTLAAKVEILNRFGKLSNPFRGKYKGLVESGSGFSLTARRDYSRTIRLKHYTITYE